MEVNEILRQCRIDVNTVYLPDIQLDRKTYLAVAQKLELIGGKWNRKAKGFIFEQNPTELLSDIQNGENRNLKKEYQFFETPEDLAKELVDFIPLNDSLNEQTVLEPSAGRGAIVRMINKLRPELKVYHCELMDLNQKMFNGNSTFLQSDFLTLPENKKYGVIVANPPFNKNQDIDHFYKMTKIAEKRVISVMSNHWKNSSNKKETEFREFVAANNVQVIDIEAGRFKESGTMISSCILVYDIE